MPPWFYALLALLLGLTALAYAVSAPATGTAPRPTLTAAGASPPATPAAPALRVVGYVTDWDVNVAEIVFDQLTHINYAFLLPDANGTFVAPEHLDQLQAVISAAHAHGVKVLISVGGWGWGAAFESLAAQPPARAHFVSTLLEFVAAYGLDGVDVDWEYPGPALGSADSFVHLMTELAQGLRPPGKLLTAAVVATGPYGDGIQAEVFELVDFLNLMAYDGPDTNHASLEYAAAALAYWRERGLPPEKTVLGVPLYARPQDVGYRDLLAADPAAADQDSVDYRGALAYYNGRPTLRAKVALAQREAGGIMIWALAHDAPGPDSLLSASDAAVHATATP